MVAAWLPLVVEVSQATLPNNQLETEEQLSNQKATKNNPRWNYEQPFSATVEKPFRIR